jgi:hypothetical protein
MSNNLENPGVKESLARKILADIDKACQLEYDGGHRAHLGASLIGHDCKRYLWYLFRWCFKEEHTGRQLRLFNRGHREEVRFVEWLRWIGANVKEFQEDGVTQFRISGVMGHFGGSLDGIATLPKEYGIDEPVLLEFKTNGTGAGFNKLTQGMAVAKPQHFAQTSVYGLKMNLKHVLYMNINKNDDSIHVEIVPLDHNFGARLELKAAEIIESETAPPKLSTNPAFQACQWCAMKHICHDNKQPERNCRSCKNARPVENAEWFCLAHGGVIPKDFIAQACLQWVSITG